MKNIHLRHSSYLLRIRTLALAAALAVLAAGVGIIGLAPVEAHPGDPNSFHDHYNAPYDLNVTSQGLFTFRAASGSDQTQVQVREQGSSSWHKHPWVGHQGDAEVSFNAKDQWYTQPGKTYQLRACSYWGVPHGTINCSNALTWLWDETMVLTANMTAAADPADSNRVGYVGYPIASRIGSSNPYNVNFSHAGESSLRLDEITTTVSGTTNTLKFSVSRPGTNKDLGDKLDNLSLILKRGGSHNAYYIRDFARSVTTQNTEYTKTVSAPLTAGAYEIYLNIAPVVPTNVNIYGSGTALWDKHPNGYIYSVDVYKEGNYVARHQPISSGFQIPDLEAGVNYDIYICANLPNGLNSACVIKDFTPNRILLQARMTTGMIQSSAVGFMMRSGYNIHDHHPGTIQKADFRYDGQKYCFTGLEWHYWGMEPGFSFDDCSNPHSHRKNEIPDDLKNNLVIKYTSVVNTGFTWELSDTEKYQEDGKTWYRIKPTGRYPSTPPTSFSPKTCNWWLFPEFDICTESGTLTIFQKPAPVSNFAISETGLITFDAVADADYHSVRYWDGTGAYADYADRISSPYQLPELNHGVAAPVQIGSTIASTGYTTWTASVIYVPNHELLYSEYMTADTQYAAGNTRRYGYSFGISLPQLDQDSFFWKGNKYAIRRLYDQQSSSESKFLLRFAKDGNYIRLPSDLESRIVFKADGRVHDIAAMSWDSQETQYYEDVASSEYFQDSQTYNIKFYVKPEAPAAPTAPAMYDGLIIEWNEVEHATSYKLRYRRDGTNDWTEQTGTVTSPSYVWRPASPDPERSQDYDVQVGAMNDHGTSWSATTDVDYNPVVPAMLVEIGDRGISTTQIGIGLQELGNYGEYLQYVYNYRKMAGGPWAGWMDFTPEMSGSGYTASVSGLEAGTRYVIRLRACLNKDIEAQCGDALIVREETLRHDGVHQPARDVTAEPADTSIKVTWDPAYDKGLSELSYALYGRKSGASDWSWIDTINCTSSGPPGACDGEMSATYDDLTAGTAYELRLQVHYQRDQDDDDVTTLLNVTTTGTPPPPPGPPQQPDPPPVQNPSLPGQAVDTPDVEWQWSDNEPITVTLREYQGKPSLIPSTVQAGSGASWSVSPGWGDVTTTTVRIITFTRSGHDNIELHWRIIDGEIEASIVE